MKISNLLFLVICTTLLWTGCKKKGCTDPKSNNFDVEAEKDDGSCVVNNLDSIIDVKWNRETDSVLYSFTLNSYGTWTTDKDCNPRTEGTWEINYQTSTLYHYFNGIQEEYDVIEPSSTVVKFRGGNNSNSDIAANNSLLVYQSQYTPSFRGVKNSYINLISQTTDITVTQSELDNISCPYKVSDFESADIKYTGEIPSTTCSDLSGLNGLSGLGGFQSWTDATGPAGDQVFTLGVEVYYNGGEIYMSINAVATEVNTTWGGVSRGTIGVVKVEI